MYAHVPIYPHTFCFVYRRPETFFTTVRKIRMSVEISSCVTLDPDVASAELCGGR